MRHLGPPDKFERGSLACTANRQLGIIIRRPARFIDAVADPQIALGRLRCLDVDHDFRAIILSRWQLCHPLVEFVDFLVNLALAHPGFLRGRCQCRHALADQVQHGPQLHRIDGFQSFRCGLWSQLFVSQFQQEIPLIIGIIRDHIKPRPFFGQRQYLFFKTLAGSISRTGVLEHVARVDRGDCQVAGTFDANGAWIDIGRQICQYDFVLARWHINTGHPHHIGTLQINRYCINF